jgi:acyl-CoA reductase-like NAD-dependent aldehyde dehydrogenase
MITPTVMELGGNDPSLFLDDAALTPAAMQR